MNSIEQRAVLTIAMMAAFADGEQAEAEREVLRRMAERFDPAQGSVNLWEIYEEVVAGRRTLAAVAADLTTPGARTLAFELATGVCEADGSINPGEQDFLTQLRACLNLGPSATAVPPPPPPASASGAGSVEPVDTEAIDRMITNYAILNSALELLPHGLATMAIVPLQMRMVYRIGQRHGYTLDRGHLRDFLATAGVGLASQAVENVARHLIGGLAGQLLGGLGRGLVGASTGAAFAFAGTYAIGQLANAYYAGGRRMEASVLRETYARLLAEGRTLFGQHAGAVDARARSLNPTDVLNLVRNSP